MGMGGCAKKQGGGLSELRRIGVAEVIRSAVEQVGVEEDVGTAVVLAVGGVAAVPGIGDVVDDVAVAGAVGSEGREIWLVGIQGVFGAGVVDYIEVLGIFGLEGMKPLWLRRWRAAVM